MSNDSPTHRDPMSRRWNAHWRTWERPAWPEYTAIRIDWFRDRCRDLLQGELATGATVVEVGAGAGWVTAELCEQFRDGKYICTDIAPGPLERIRELGFANVETRLPQETASLEGKAQLVVCGDVYEHVVLEARDDFVRGLRRLLAPGGHLLLSTPNLFFPVLWLNRLRGREATGQPYDRPVSSSRLRQDLARSGFDVLTLESRSPTSGPEYCGSSALRTAVLRAGVFGVGLGFQILGLDTRAALLAHAVVSR